MQGNANGEPLQKVVTYGYATTASQMANSLPFSSSPKLHKSYELAFPILSA